MNDVALIDTRTGELILDERGDGALALFKPEEARARQVAIDAGIAYAAEMRDMAALESGAEAKVEHAARCVGWWQANVTDGQSPGRNGRKSVAVRGLISVSEAEEVIRFSKQAISKLAKRLKDREKFRNQVVNAALKKVMGGAEASQLVQQSLSDEHYTPAKYIEAARAVLGAIDLDPASSDEAQKIVKADEYFTAKRSGLDMPWHGRVWMNPPYGSLVPIFIDKLMGEIREGRVTAAVVLVNAHCTDTTWFQNLWDGVLCFTDHRINFYGDESRSGSTHGSVFAYFGPERSAFIREFQQFGAVVARAIE